MARDLFEEFDIDPTEDVDLEADDTEDLFRRFNIDPASIPQQEVQKPMVEEPQQERTLGGLIKNIPGSALRTAKTFAQPILHPIETARGLADVGVGAAAKVLPEIGKIVSPGISQAISESPKGQEIGQKLQDITEEDRQKVDQVVESFKERYGGVENLKQTAFEDPVGLLTEAAFLVSGVGGAIAKAGTTAGKISKIGQVGRAVQKTGTAVNPVIQTGRAIAGTGKITSNLLRTIAGVFPETVKQIKRIGISRVDKIGRKGRPAGIFTEDIVPRVQKNFNKLISNPNENTTQFLKKVGVSESSINTIKKNGINKVKLTSKRLGEGFGTITERIKKGLLAKSDAANNAFKAVFKRSAPDNIPLNKTVDSMKAVLVQADIMTSDGVLKQIEKLSPTQKGLAVLFQDMRTKTAQNAGRVTKSQYTTFRNRLNDLGKGSDFENKLARRVKKAMTQEVTEVVPELKRINKLFREKSLKMDENFDSIKESILKRKNLDLATRKQLKELNDFLPDEFKFADDVERLKAADELNDVITNFNNPEFIEGQLGRFKQYKNPGVAKLDEIRDLYKHFGDKKIADDALSVFLAEDVHQRVTGAGFLGVSGITRKATEAGVRGGLRTHEIGKGALDIGRRDIRDILPLGQVGRQ